MIVLAHDACRDVLAHETLNYLNWHGPRLSLQKAFLPMLGLLIVSASNQVYRCLSQQLLERLHFCHR